MGNKPRPEHENIERITAAAWQLFQQKGYRGVTVDEICQRCGVTKPTLYYYFHDKEELFVTVLRQQLERFRGVLQGPGSTGERLQRLAAAVLDNFQAEYTVLMRDREHIRRPENQQAVREAFRGCLFNPLAALMEAGLQGGELRGRSAEMLALVFLGMVNNFIHRAAAPENAELAAELSRLFLEGASNK